MNELVYDLINNYQGLSPWQIVAHIIVSGLIGGLIYVSYFISHRGTIYSKKFNLSLLVLTVLTGTVMTVIGNNVALSLGMVGALSIVRFRTALKDTRDTVYVFWAIVAGICCGVGDYLVAGIGSGVVFILFIVFGVIKNDNRMLLIVRGARSSETGIKALAFKLFEHKAQLRVENTTETTVEIIYEISNRTLAKAEKLEPDITEAFYGVGQIEYVNIVLQNDDISS